MKTSHYEHFKNANSHAAGALLEILKREEGAVTVVHHNDADGLCAAAALSRLFTVLSVDFSLLPVEKIHELILEGIHRHHRGCVIYADLGGQSSELVGTCAARNSLVLILDHHLPGGEVPDNVLHINPELYGINGDTDISGAAVSSLFAVEMLRQSGVAPGNVAAELALYGALGAFGDRQLTEGKLTGMNQMLLAEALEHGPLQESRGSLVIPGLGNRGPEDVIEILNLLGSIGFYAGEAEKAVRFLLGKNQGDALETASRLAELRDRLFDSEFKRIRDSGLCRSPHFDWLDVKDRFFPMGVKAIGLFLEQLIERQAAGAERYVIGFQHFPDSAPGIGDIGLSLTKVSARVPRQLREKIEQGILPDLMRLIPEATRVLGGLADGCHRFSAASLISRGHEQAFIEALETTLSQ